MLGNNNDIDEIYKYIKLNPSHFYANCMTRLQSLKQDIKKYQRHLW